MNDVIEEIANERQRQKGDEGWTEAHDDAYRNYELERAAASYAFPVWEIRESERQQLMGLNPIALKSRPPKMWPWSAQWWKPKSKRANLIRAGALIVAAIERIDRQEPTT